tara:strand:- start:1181 stop:1576 length:396 start_codon:yes stop_codon:yes gene_type:complete
MNLKLNKLLAEISAGELVDKITILEIKKKKIKDQAKLAEVEKELISLNNTFQKNISQNADLKNMIKDLKEINLKLWDIEDGKREAEKNKKFDNKFIELARNVYKLNDERAKIKLKINQFLGSNIKEVKSYN